MPLFTSLKDLDRDALSEHKTLTALVVPKQQCACTMKMFKGRMFKMPRMKCLVDNPADEASKLLLLEESLVPSAIPSELDETLRAHVTENSITVTTHTLRLTYDHFSAEDILRKVLPADVDVPSSFEAVGHIAHYNLRPPHVPYKHIIGQVCIDKNPTIRTVVTKVKEIENEFRVFDMEVIAGEKNFVTEVSQHGLRFRLDFSKVFWNSRLEYEHKRLVDKYFKRGDVILDVMAGIGPFAVPAAKAGCTVIANDLNPDSVHWLKVNAEINHVKRSIHPLCMDGRECIRWVSSGIAIATTARMEANGAKLETEAAGWTPPEHGQVWQHAVMNLPRTAVEFCDAFHGAFPQNTWQDQLPLIHCYTFQKSETEADVLERVEDALGCPLDEPALIHQVRHVAPDKYHVCVTFRVPKAVAFADVRDKRQSKRQKVGA